LERSFVDLFAVQCTPSGRHNWDITMEKNICRLFEKSLSATQKVAQFILGNYCRSGGELMHVR
jgi:hypothetical protein